jgi:predicted acetylornithine/succinylornithine family transaminase
MPNYPAPPITLVRGEGTKVWDTEGREYLDFLTGLAVCSLGHSHPKVADAVAEQARTLLHVSNLYGNEIGPQVASTIDRLLGTPGWADGWTDEPPRGRVFFANSGAEANECAIKLARRFGGRGRHVVVSALGSFHGRTLATLHATGQPAKHEPFQPLPEGFRHVAWDDLAALKQALDGSVAAVLLEPMQGEGGVNPATAGYVRGVRELCDERGTLLMFDEVQTGLGRTGRWFGHHHFGVVPDVVTLAKALGNGVPIGACWARAEIAAVFEPGDHGSTFGGQPFAAAAARATLAEMEAIDAPGLARRAGERLTAGLGEAVGVSSTRGMGLLLAAELEGGNSRAVSAACLDRGLIVNPVTPTALRFAPPLTVTDDEIDLALGIVADAIAAVAASPAAEGAA